MAKINPIVLIWIISIIISPFTWVLFRNASLISTRQERFLTHKDQVLVDEVNTIRGEIAQEVPNYVSKVLISRYVFVLKEWSVRYFQSYDPNYLFFQGDIDGNKSTHASGPLFLAYLPFFIVGFFFALKSPKKYILLFSLLLVSPLFASFLAREYETISRIPFLLAFLGIAAIGVFKLRHKNKFVFIVILTVLLFEIVRFQHDFFTHYPRRQSESLYSFRK